MIKVEQVNKHEYKVSAYNNVDMGIFYQEIDGYFVWLPIQRGGYLPAEMLLAIGNKLVELNAPWDAQVQAYHSSEQS